MMDMGPAALIISIAVSLALIPLAIKAAHRYSILDKPGRHKRHAKPTPFLGGAVLFAAMWLTILVISLAYPDRIDLADNSLFYILAGAVIITLTGLIDDMRPLPTWPRLLVQIGVGLILFFGGVRVELLTTPWGSIDMTNYSALLTVAWVVGLTNAINIIDGLDGLASGVCLIAASTLVVIGMSHDMGWIQVIAFVLIGFLLPFLFFNSRPAKIFLGDSGSMQLGYYFAVFSLLVRFKSFTLSALFVPLLTLGVPITEAASSVIRRLITGKSLMSADRRHLFHYLSWMGLSQRQIVLVFYAMGVIFGLFAVGMNYWNRPLVLTLLVLFMVVIFVVYFILVTGLSRRLRNGSARHPRKANSKVE